MKKLAMIALRNLSRNKRRSIITMTALVAGLTLVLTAKGFANGFVELSTGEVVEGSTGALQVHRTGYLDNLEGAPLKLSMAYSEALLAKIRAVPGVKAATGRIQFDGLVNNGVSQTTFMGRGLDLDTEYAALPRSGAHVEEGGRQLHAGDFRVALIGAQLAGSFNAMTPEARKNAPPPAAGQASPTTMVTLNSTSPKGRANSLSVQIVGLTGGGNAFESKRVITVPLPLAQDLLNMKGQVTEIAVAVNDLRQLDRVVDTMRAALGPDYDVQPWTQLQPFARDGVKRITIVFAVITVVFMIIVLTGVVNTMLMSVFERVREIGTMLALGTRQGQIRILFLFEAAILSGFGAALGCVLAECITYGLHQRGILMPASSDVLRPTLPLDFVGVAIVVTIVSTLVAAIYPAWRASKLNPVDALRSV